MVGGMRFRCSSIIIKLSNLIIIKNLIYLSNKIRIYLRILMSMITCKGDIIYRSWVD